GQALSGWTSSRSVADIQGDRRGAIDAGTFDGRRIARWQFRSDNFSARRPGRSWFFLHVGQRRFGWKLAASGSGRYRRTYAFTGDQSGSPEHYVGGGRWWRN